MDKYSGCVNAMKDLREAGTHMQSGFVRTHCYASFCFLRKLSSKYTAKAVIL
ncbi:hypothetical protein SAMN06296952_0961 [Oscillospiraceae bacterium]|nr:hypothetical protein SAMN06296952_0961 [Oscillospiraceae bacterium]